MWAGMCHWLLGCREPPELSLLVMGVIPPLNKWYPSQLEVQIQRLGHLDHPLRKWLLESENKPITPLEVHNWVRLLMLYQICLIAASLLFQNCEVIFLSYLHFKDVFAANLEQWRFFYRTCMDGYKTLTNRLAFEKVIENCCVQFNLKHICQAILWWIISIKI